MPMRLPSGKVVNSAVEPLTVKVRIWTALEMVAESVIWPAAMVPVTTPVVKLPVKE